MGRGGGGDSLISESPGEGIVLTLSCIDLSVGVCCPREGRDCWGEGIHQLYASQTLQPPTLPAAGGSGGPTGAPTIPLQLKLLIYESCRTGKESRDLLVQKPHVTSQKNEVQSQLNVYSSQG